MAKYKVLETFRDKHTKELYEVGEEIEMTVKRAKEAEKNLAKHGKVFLERVEEPKEEQPEADTVEEGEK
jgi:hypothetical protein